MISIADVAIDAKATLGDEMLLTGVHPVYEYKEGIRQNSVIGYRYEVVLPKKRFEKVSVKVLGAQKVEIPIEEDYREVEFTGLTMHIYRIQGEYRLYCEASDIHALDDMVATASTEE